jgi:hypothetical protein
MRRSCSVFTWCLQRSHTRSTALPLLAVLLTADSVSAQQRRIQLDHLAKVVTASDRQIYPDGKSIV